MRIVSLVPNATEILFALGIGDQVVGVSHECDFPEEARALPILTGSALEPGLSSAEIDDAVSTQVGSGCSLYTLNEERIADLAPDLIVTQELCPVCAVSAAQVDGVIRTLPHCPGVLSLDPKTFRDVLGDILRVGEATGSDDRALALVKELGDRVDEVEKRVAWQERPKVLALEWLDPPFVAGHWVPEMIEYAGGRDVVAAPGDPSRRMTWEEIAALDPDWIVAMPCGFSEAGATAELGKLADHAAWQALRAVQGGHVAAVDANGCFSRPGPRLVAGVERLAQILHGKG
jgi:iron complex transport system substrate-binding protein